MDLGYEYYIGIDPGLNGGVVILSKSEVVEVFRTPATIQDFIESLGKYMEEKVFCITENVHSMPFNGAKSNFTFGYINGILHTVLQISSIPYEEHTPQKWMKFYGMKKNKHETDTAWKNRLKAEAQKLFPKEKVTLWNADAFLIANYCREIKK